MCSIEKIIKNLRGLHSLPPSSEQVINNAEKKLGLHFADDYRIYTKIFGAISANGIELTGVVDTPRLNVINATTSEKSLNNNIPNDMYVIENIGIEGIVMLQNEKGEIFSVAPNSKPEKQFDSLAEYLVTLYKET